MSSLPDVQPTSTKYPVRYPLTVTQEMDEKLTQLLGRMERGTSRNDMIRLALRQYIDDQEDVIGSRRHFSKSLQKRLDVMEFKLIFYFDILIYMSAACFALIISYVTRDSKVQAINMIRQAIIQTRNEGPTLNQQLGGLIEDLTDDS